MFVVALIGLRTAIDDEAPALAADLRMTTYEAALLLRAATPTIVLRTDDRGRATDLLLAMRGRGHEVVAFDDAAVVDSEAMTRPRSFRLEADALVSVGQPESRLPFVDLLAIVRAEHQTTTETVVATKERTLSLGRAALSGGLVASKTVTKERAQSVEQREPVAYLFRRSGEPPWLLASGRLRYDALAPHVRPSQLENFEALIGRLRESAPSAAYDARLLAVRAPSKLRSDGRGASRATSSSGVDVLAHVVAMAVARGR